MALSKERKIFHRKQIDLLDFPSDFGEMNPISSFRGPKTPSNRQVLRYLLHWLEQGRSLKEAADKTVMGIYLRHPNEDILKQPRVMSVMLFWHFELNFVGP